jgi:DNA-binding MarR family transcriptional regulator
MDAATTSDNPREPASELAVDGPPVRPATMLLRELLDVSDLFEARLRGHLSVNPTDLEAMEHLLSSGPLGPSELSRRLGISTAATTTAIDRLVGLGHVTRAAHPSDRRGVLVVPTDTSRDSAMALLLPMIMGVDAVLDRFTADEQRIITDYLSAVVEVYRAHAGASED